MPPTATDNASVEDERLANWRRDAWRKLGWNADWSDFLATTQMDIRQAEKMLSAGATHDQIVGILAGYGPLDIDPLFDWNRFQFLSGKVNDDLDYPSTMSDSTGA